MREWHLLIAKLSLGKGNIATLPPDFLNISTQISWEQLMIGISVSIKNWLYLNGLSIGIIRFEICWSPIFGDIDNYISCHVTFWGFPEISAGWRMFFDLSLLDVQ